MKASAKIVFTDTVKAEIQFEVRESVGEKTTTTNLEKIVGTNESPIISYSFTGATYENYRTESCGQCHDEIRKLAEKHLEKGSEKYHLVMKLLGMWEADHLNDMHPGTDRQESLLKECGVTAWASQYKETCAFLNERLLHNDRGYYFGTKWLYKRPTHSVEDVMQVISAINDK